MRQSGQSGRIGRIGLLLLLLAGPARATIDLRYNTASQEIAIGIVLDSTNGNDEETGLTLAAADIHIWKAGGTRTFHGNAAATHMNNGIFYYVADANDTNTKGPLVLWNHTTGGLAERVECRVLDPNEYDRLYSTGEINVYSLRGLDPNTAIRRAVYWGVVDDYNDVAGTFGAEFVQSTEMSDVTDVDAVLTANPTIGKLGNATYGLAALKAIIDPIGAAVGGWSKQR